MTTTTDRLHHRRHRQLNRELNLLLVNITARPPAAAYALLAEVISAGRSLVTKANHAEMGGAL